MITGKRGFTLVELVVVIATIGILAAIVLVGLNRYQGDTRDARRASSASTISEALEKYYDQNGEYPSCAAVTSDANTVTSSTLVGLSKNTLLAPQAPASDTNSLKCGSTSTLTISGTDFFQYDGDGSAECNGALACLSYTLKYRDESSGTIKSVSSRRNTSIATSGAATLSIAGSSFNYIDLSWTTVQNASSYVVQMDNSPAFNVGSVNQWSVASGNTFRVPGLTGSSTYYFRVQPTGGVWSNTIAGTTLSIATPTLTGTVNSSTQITVSWNSVALATSYTLERSTNSDYSGATITSGITGSGTITNVSSGLTTGTPYYFRVKAVNGVNQGSYSTYTGTPIVPAPATFNLTSTGYVTATANVTCSLGTPYYYWYANGAAWVEGAGQGSPTYSLGYGQGITLTARARCDYSGTSSAWTSGSNSIAVTRPTPGPTWTRLQYVSDRHTWLEWTNVCGGPNEVISYQGSYSSGWNAPLYNGSGPGGGRSYNNYWLGEYADWSSYGTTTHYVRTTCNGSTGTSSAGTINF